MKKAKIIFVVVLLLALAIGAYFVFGSYSDGSRAGTLVKLSKKGILFKTWEGELNTYMYVGDQAAASAGATLWVFSVESSDEEARKVMETAMLNGHRVKLYYKERYFQFPWNGDTKYFVYKAEVEKPAK